jgi:hypothetical protein
MKGARPTSFILEIDDDDVLQRVLFQGRCREGIDSIFWNKKLAKPMEVTIPSAVKDIDSYGFYQTSGVVRVKPDFTMKQLGF